MKKKLGLLIYPFTFVLTYSFFVTLSQYLEEYYSLLIFTHPTWPTLETNIQNFKFIFLFSFILVVTWFFIFKKWSVPKNIILALISFIIFSILYILFVRNYYSYINMQGYEACHRNAKIPGENAPIENERLKIEDFIKANGVYSSTWKKDRTVFYSYNSRYDTYTCLIEVNSDGIIEHYLLDVKL